MPYHQHQQFTTHNGTRFLPVYNYDRAKGIAMKFTNLRSRLLMALVGAGLRNAANAEAQVVQQAAPVSYNMARGYQAAPAQPPIAQTAPSQPAMSYQSAMPAYGDCGSSNCGSSGCGSSGAGGGPATTNSAPISGCRQPAGSRSTETSVTRQLSLDCFGPAGTAFSCVEQELIRFLQRGQPL
jgi:hypothetical protein